MAIHLFQWPIKRTTRQLNAEWNCLINWMERYSQIIYTKFLFIKLLFVCIARTAKSSFAIEIMFTTVDQFSLETIGAKRIWKIITSPTKICNDWDKFAASALCAEVKIFKIRNEIKNDRNENKINSAHRHLHKMSTCDIYTYFWCLSFVYLFICLLFPLAFLPLYLRDLDVGWFALLLLLLLLFSAQFILTFHIRRDDVFNVSYVSLFNSVFIFITFLLLLLWFILFLFLSVNLCVCAFDSMSCSFTQRYTAFHIVFDYYYLFRYVLP